MKMLEMFKDRNDAEATLHWSRNSYFLVVMSVLALAITQNPAANGAVLTVLRVFISAVGLGLSGVWYAIQYRSSQYVLYYKKQVSILTERTKLPEMYPKDLKGVEMRLLAYLLPLAFILFWAAILITVLY
jgi:hypothetical protein